MFPKGSPGVALLLLRIALSLNFVQERWVLLTQDEAGWPLLGTLVLVVALCVGLLTPLMCLVCAVTEVATWTMGGAHWQQIHLCVIFVSTALALLGPGAYSIDGRAYGRRKVIFPPSEPPGGV